MTNFCSSLLLIVLTSNASEQLIVQKLLTRVSMHWLGRSKFNAIFFVVFFHHYLSCRDFDGSKDKFIVYDVTRRNTQDDRNTISEAVSPECVVSHEVVNASLADNIHASIGPVACYMSQHCTNNILRQHSQVRIIMRKIYLVLISTKYFHEEWQRKKRML